MTNMFTAGITGLSHDGRGITHVNGKTIFIDGALPNETVRAQYTNKRSQFDEAKLVEVIIASPERVEPPCQHFGVCGGCSIQHMSPTLQIQHKQQVLLNQLKHFGHVEPESILPPITGPTLGYRRKGRLGVRYVRKKQRLLVGFREINGRMLADLTQCEVLDPRVGKKLTELAAMITDLVHYDHIPQIEVAAGDDKVALIFRHMVALDDNEKQQLCEFGRTHHFDIYLQPAGMDSIHKIYPNDGNLRLSYKIYSQQLDFEPGGSEGVYIQDMGKEERTSNAKNSSAKSMNGLELLFHPADFTQVNIDINQKMIQQTLNLLDLSPTDNVLDLFCGLGNFTLPIAKGCQHVTGVEGNAAMVKRGYENAQHNQIDNVTFYSADLMENITQYPWFKPGYDKILLDPPRAGAQEIVTHMAKLAVNRIVYVSCHPATLARDAGILVQQGYRLKCVGVMDMFPHTEHVESIAMFEMV